MLALPVYAVFYVSLFFVIQLPQPSEYVFYVLGISAGVMLIDAALLLRRADNQTNRFISWVDQNKRTLENGQLEYSGFMIDRNTEFIRYGLVFSFILVTISRKTPLYISGHDNTRQVFLRSTLLTFAFGWWGFPFGPILTIPCLIRNAIGGERKKVGDLIEELGGGYKPQITVTPETVSYALSFFKERKYPSNMALRITLNDKKEVPYEVKYSLPESERSRQEWLFQIDGLPVLIEKKIAKQVDGIVVDRRDGEYVFYREEEL